MKKTIRRNLFLEIARKHEEGIEMLPNFLENGKERIRVAEHTYCRFEKSWKFEGCVDLHIHSKRGYYDNLDKMIEKNPFIMELVANCE